MSVKSIQQLKTARDLAIDVSGTLLDMRVMVESAMKVIDDNTRLVEATKVLKQAQSDVSLAKKHIMEVLVVEQVAQVADER
jgi:hypothetical protein